MKTLFLATALYVLGSFIPPSSADTVYYCDSPGGKRYHYDQECSGLQRCTHVIRQTTVKSAVDRGLTPCLLEK